MGPKGANTILSWKDLVNPKMIRFDEEGSLEALRTTKRNILCIIFLFFFSPKTLILNWSLQLTADQTGGEMREKTKC